MKHRTGQEFWGAGWVTIPLPARMRLARAERERLWKGLEWFVNCDDSLGRFGALGRAFSKFWPIQTSHFTNPECMNPATVVQQFDWHPACHTLFLFYRDTLRSLWGSKPDPTGWTYLWGTKFLLGVDDSNEQAIHDARDHRRSSL